MDSCLRRNDKVGDCCLGGWCVGLVLNKFRVLVLKSVLFYFLLINKLIFLFSMNNFAIFIIIITMIGILFYSYKNKIYSFLESSKKGLPFKRKEFLMNIPERKFFKELQKIIPNNYIAFPQVLLSSIVRVTSSRKDFWKYHNKINRKTIDYVIFEKPYFKPVLVIEYDGKTHDKPDRIERDIKVKNILNSSGIKNFHTKHQKNINFEEIKNKIDELILNKNY